MSFAIVSDAACDLPKEYIVRRQLHILPIHLRFGNQIADDLRDPNLAMRFYRTYIENKDIDAETSPYSPQETAALFKRLLAHHERVLCITITRARSRIFDHAVQAAGLLKGAGEGGRVQIIDSNSLFAGQAAVVAGALELAAQGADFDTVIREVKALTGVTRAYVLPRDLYYVRARARKRGDNSVGLLQYVAGQALDIKPIIHARGPQAETVHKIRGFAPALTEMFARAVAVIERGVRVPVLPLSYAGNPKEVVAHPGYRRLETVARARDVQLLVSVMSTTAGVYLGPGAFGFGYLPRDVESA
jgi:DegV family protein with EDD domain